MLAERGVALEVIRALAGHVDVRMTQIYVDVRDRRKADGIAALGPTGHPWLRSRLSGSSGQRGHRSRSSRRGVLRRRTQRPSGKPRAGVQLTISTARSVSTASQSIAARGSWVLPLDVCCPRCPSARQTSTLPGRRRDETRKSYVHQLFRARPAAEATRRWLGG
jgi:hypothetical protein